MEEECSSAGAMQIGSVEQPPAFLQLKELTDRSARIAQFKLSVCHPWEDSYTYSWIGEERTATAFKCLLVDVNDPTCIVTRNIGKLENTKSATKLR